MRILIGIVPLILAFCFSSTVVLADGDGHDPMRKAIKAREAEMTLRTWNAEPLFDMAKGDVKYDAERAATLANNLLVMTTANNGHMWPKGSDNEMYPDDTEALPEIWSTWPEIANKGQAYIDAVKALAEVAATGLDGLRSKIGDIGQAYKGCHDDFRAEHRH